MAACGRLHAAAVTEDGKLFVWGEGSNGQLGLGDISQRRQPTLLPLPRLAVGMVSLGKHHTGIVSESGDLLMCGAGGDGRLGLGDEGDRRTPTLIDPALLGHDAVLMVDCGAEHTVVLTEAGGRVLTFGAGENGQLGHGDWQRRMLPTQVPAAWFNDERIVMVAAGGWHTTALSEEGRVFTWGSGGHGQLGHGDRHDRCQPLQVEPEWFGSEKVVFVAGGQHHSLAVCARVETYTYVHTYIRWSSHGITAHDARSRCVQSGED